MTDKKRLIVIDCNSLIHRAYHALPPLTTKKGDLVNAVYGFLLVFFKAIQEFQPDYIAATFDVHAPTFRHKEFKEYKAKRPPAPEELYQQIPITKEVLSAFNVPIYEKEGFEADDIIGTIVRLAVRQQILPQLDIIVVSGDLDTLQLINSQTRVFVLRKGVKDTTLYDKDTVIEKYQGLEPKQLIDFKALRGDPSDNIPGVTGIGEKTAVELIKEFKNLDNLYNALDKNEITSDSVKARVKEILLQQKEQAFFSKSLVQIRMDAPIEFSLENCQWKRYNKEKVTKVLENLEFYSLVKRVPSLTDESKVIKKNLKLL